LASVSGRDSVRQEKKINEKIGAPPTMCSLDDNTLVPEIHKSKKVFGRPVNPGEAAVAGGVEPKPRGTSTIISHYYNIPKSTEGKSKLVALV